MPFTIMGILDAVNDRYAEKTDILRAFVAVRPGVQLCAWAATKGVREPSQFLRYHSWVQSFTSSYFIVEAWEQLP